MASSIDYDRLTLWWCAHINVGEVSAIARVERHYFRVSGQDLSSVSFVVNLVNSFRKR